MHEHDFTLLEKREESNGDALFRVKINALNLSRDYHYSKEHDSINIAGEERTILVGGHDMTSIIGKRVREFLRSSALPESRRQD
ncbi:hypothetical protein BH09SUM1_BH09SUM1_18490 [soil metagenome]